MGTNKEPLILEKLPTSRDRETAPGGQDSPGSAFSSCIEGRVSLPDPNALHHVLTELGALVSQNPGVARASKQSPRPT